MMALPEIKSVADLKGKTVGVTRFGSSTDFALRYLVQKNGFNPDKDLNILRLGGMPELAAALSKRLIVAAPRSAPTHIRARAAELSHHSTWPKPASTSRTRPSSPVGLT
jgi:ABC-type nitrate/sulfonate/bicarbonate transport system substrate-binding protein